MVVFLCCPSVQSCSARHDLKVTFKHCDWQILIVSFFHFHIFFEQSVATAIMIVVSKMHKLLVPWVLKFRVSMIVIIEQHGEDCSSNTF